MIHRNTEADANRNELRPLTVTVETTKKLSGLGNTTIWGLIKNGTLETTFVGRRRLVLYSSLERLLSPKSSVA